MSEIPLNVRFVKIHGAAKLPTKGSALAAGWDLYATSALVLAPGQTQLVSTGLKIAVPEGYEAQVRPRSGLAFKQGVTVLNSPGTIDADYRGPLGVILTNTSRKRFEVEVGMRIAQLVVQPVVTNVKMVEVSEFEETERGEDGFGSTGT